MTIFEIVRQAFHFALTHRSLWVFGFFVGVFSGGSNSGGGHSGDQGGALAGAGLGAAAAASSIAIPPGVGLLIVLAALLLLAIGLVLRFVGEAALIEGVVRARRGETLSTREGFHVGWTHWGVLVRIALLYVAAVIGSVAILAVPCVLAVKAFGWIGGLALGIPAAIVLVPWLVTITLVQSFAWRIAVLEDRRAVDAIRKARLFLHGRLIHGLKLVVATFVGSLGFAAVAVVTMVPVAVATVALVPLLGVWPVVAVVCAVLLPIAAVLTAMLGTFRSSVWTLGYVTQVES